MSVKDTSPTLEVRDLQTHFFTKAGVAKAVDGVSFSVGKGEIMISPLPTEKLTPSTAFATPAFVKKCVCRSRTSRVGDVSLTLIDPTSGSRHPLIDHQPN